MIQPINLRDFKMIKKLILISLVVASGSVFADSWSDFQQKNNQQETLRLQQEQNWIMQQQLQQQQEAMRQQQSQRQGFF